MAVAKISENKTKAILTKYASEGNQILFGLNESELSSMVLYANDLYHTKGLSIITDSQYDLLREYIQEQYPDNTAILQVGAPIRAKDKVRLPYNMPSMDKIKPDSTSLSTWASKYIGPYVISCKLDGVSGMYSTEDSTPKLYTRGDGSVGQDISHLIKALRLPNHKGYVVRGEFIITKSVFKDKYSDSFSNARNLVAGFVNSKTLDKTVHDVHFVCYEVIKSPNGQIKPSVQMRTIEEIGHETVQNKMVDSWSKDTLSDLLLVWRSTSDYEMDGIIVSDNNIYPRSAKNPSHAFAFKMALDEQTTTTQVVDVIWKTSQDGYLKPRVRVVPVYIGGVTIEYATGFNGKFIEENKIGPGAVVKLIRSGDVIPYIQSVISQAPGGAKMPVKYKWNPTHVDIIVVDIESNIDVKEKNIIGFFTDLETESLSAGNLRRIIDAGYNSIPAIIHMSVADLLNIDGFKEKMAVKIHSSIDTALKKASLTEIMTASNKFGRGMGLKIISGLMEKNPDFLISTSPRQVKIQQLNDSGIHKGAETFLEGIEPFKVFLADCDLSYKLESVQKEVKTVAVHPLNGKAVVMSGIRDKEIADFLTTVGATLEESMKSNVVALIVKDPSKETAKTKEALKKNIPIITVGEFKKKYMYP